MILAWASPFNSAGRALSSKILWPTKINLLCQKKDIAQSVAQQ